jgi:hypothetical protein
MSIGGVFEGCGLSQGLFPGQLYSKQLITGAGSRFPFTVSAAPAWGDRAAARALIPSWEAAVVAMAVLAAATDALSRVTRWCLAGVCSAVSVKRPQDWTRLS